jgi:hypothetical protein
VPTDAPPDLETDVRAVFRTYEAPELPGHAASLAAWLAAEGFVEGSEDGFSLSDLTPTDVADTDAADVDTSKHEGVAVTHRSPWSLDDHAGLVVRADQTFLSESGFSRYVRTVTGDVDAFLARAGAIQTSNDVEQVGALGARTPYVLRKDYRWVVEGEETLLVARSWLSEPGCSDDARDCVFQSFGVDLLRAVDGGAERVLSSWVELTTSVDGFVTDAQASELRVTLNRNLLLAADEALAAE